MVDNMRLSVTCGVKDREASLRQALPSWLEREEVDEVLLVDWSSKKLLKAGDLWLCDPRVVVVQVEGQPHWTASKCHNLELLLATGHLILRLDADDVLHDDFFSRHPFRQDEVPPFYSFEPLTARDDNETHLAGVVYARRADFLAIGGYNERIEVYGYEDSDLIGRLEARVGGRRNIDPDTLHHLPHDEDSRFANQPDAKFKELDERFGGRTWAYKLYGKAGRASLANRAQAEDFPWTIADRKAIWNVEKRDTRSYGCSEEVPT
jgi:hypothetical protein